MNRRYSTILQTSNQIATRFRCRLLSSKVSDSLYHTHRCASMCIHLFWISSLSSNQIKRISSTNTITLLITRSRWIWIAKQILTAAEKFNVVCKTACRHKLGYTRRALVSYSLWKLVRYCCWIVAATAQKVTIIQLWWKFPLVTIFQEFQRCIRYPCNIKPEFDYFEFRLLKTVSLLLFTAHDRRWKLENEVILTTSTSSLSPLKFLIISDVTL